MTDEEFQQQLYEDAYLMKLRRADITKVHQWVREHVAESNPVRRHDDRTVSPDMIARAKEYPIDNLLPIKNNTTHCIFHQDTRPSMYTKNNWVYCWSCGKSGDAIDVYRILHGCSFQEAVKALQ